MHECPESPRDSQGPSTTNDSWNERIKRETNPQLESLPVLKFQRKYFLSNLSEGREAESATERKGP
jgi:hypothetical protein